MKRIITIFICLAAVVSFASCGAEEEPDTKQLADESYSRALDLYSRGAYVSAGIVIDKAVEEYGPEERFEELKKQVKEAADAALTTTEEYYTEESPYERWLTETQPEPETEPAATAPSTTKPETTTKAAATTTAKQKATTSTTVKKASTTTKPAATTTRPATKATTAPVPTTTKPTTHKKAEPRTTKAKGGATTAAPETTTAAPETEPPTEAPEEGTTNLELT